MSPKEPAAGDESGWSHGDGTPAEHPERAKGKPPDPTTSHGPPDQCTATSKTSGRRCRRIPTKGRQTCYYHKGGTRKEAQEEARRLALKDLWPKAVRAWERALEEDRDPDPVMMRAAEAVADRTGHPGVRRSELGNVPGEEPFQVVMSPKLGSKKKKAKEGASK